MKNHCQVGNFILSRKGDHMCRLLGIYGHVDFWKELSMGFRQLADTGRIPPEKYQTPGHKDGWGITMSNSEKSAMTAVMRQLGSANDSSCYREAFESIETQPHVVMCHLRKASDNIPITLANTHPFCWREWALIHNGTVFNAEFLPRDPSLPITSDRSDTEYLFYYLMTQISDKNTGKNRLEIITNAVRAINVDFTSTNCLLSNGNELFVIRNYRKWDDYYSLYYYALPAGVIVCSEPLPSQYLSPERWQLLDNNIVAKIYGIPPKIEKLSVD
ncbi:MAG: class II glutamine amidotransferase [Desulfobacterales bacterium]|jgi:predicted glutamine amidotransferase